VGGVILPKRSICRVAGRLEIAGHGLTRFVAPHSGLRLCCLGRDHRRRLHDGQQRRLDRVIDAQAAKRDAVGLAVSSRPRTQA
jgi:hypothetical protein